MASLVRANIPTRTGEKLLPINNLLIIFHHNDLKHKQGIFKQTYNYARLANSISSFLLPETNKFTFGFFYSLNLLQTQSKTEKRFLSFSRILYGGKTPHYISFQIVVFILRKAWPNLFKWPGLKNNFKLLDCWLINLFSQSVSCVKNI